MMNAFELIWQCEILRGIQYDEDVEEAYADEERRNTPTDGYWRDAGLGVEQWVEF